MIKIWKSIIILILGIFLIYGCQEDKAHDVQKSVVVAEPAEPSVNNDPVEPAGLTFSTMTGSLSEAGTSVSFTLRLNSAPQNEVKIEISFGDSDEVSVLPSELIFTSENWSLEQSVVITGLDDFVTDGPQRVLAKLDTSNSKDTNYQKLNPEYLTLENADNDTTGFTIGGIDADRRILGKTSEGGNTVNFTVRLHSKPLEDVSISIASTDSTEGVVNKSELIFTSLNWNQDQTVTVTGVDDLLKDGEMLYTIRLFNVNSTDYKYNQIDPDDIITSNTDDEVPDVLISKSAVLTQEDGSTDSFTVVLASRPLFNVPIRVTITDETEGEVSEDELNYSYSLTLTFTSDNWNTLQTVFVRGLDDKLMDGDQIYTISIEALESGDNDYHLRAVDDVLATNDDDDTAGFRLSSMSTYTTEWGGQATFTVQLTALPTDNVVVPISVSDPTEAKVDPSSLTFKPGDWDYEQTVTVIGVEDPTPLPDGDQNYAVMLGPITGDDPVYKGYVDPTGVMGVNKSLTVVKTGESHSCAVLGLGSIKCWGKGDSGQLGDGNTNTQNTPVSVSSLTTVAHAALGKEHSCALNFDGTVWCWGAGDRGQLGTGSTTDSTVPIQVMGITNAVDIEAGDYHNCVILADKSTQCWGANDFGQIGNNATSDALTPTLVSNVSGVIDIAAGASHTCAITSNDTTGDASDDIVYCWGKNEFGQLGIDSTSDSLTPLQVIARRCIADSTLEYWECGEEYTFEEEQYWTAWDTTHDIFNNLVKVEAGGNHTCALKGSGEIWCWGSNSNGQLGKTIQVPQKIFTYVEVPIHSTRESALEDYVALSAGSTLSTWVNGNLTAYDTSTDSNILEGAGNISSGGAHTCSGLQNGTVKCWGAGESGQLGNGDSQDSAFPVLVDGIP